jgi:sugar lactone lactonase YvrE
VDPAGSIARERIDFCGRSEPAKWEEMKMKTTRLGAIVLSASIAWLMPARAADRTEITFPGDHAYPESLTATSDGTIYAGSLYQGGIFRVPPGAATAEQWIKPGANNSMSTLGVFADEKAGTLWVCSSNLGAFGVKPPAGEKPVSLQAFDLKNGTAKGSWPLPGEKSLCNDMVVGSDGAVYVAESFQPHILKLAPGGTALEVWATDPRFSGGEGPGLDGITIGPDGNLYVNTYATGRLFRVEIGQGGKAGQITEFKTTPGFEHPDGMRAYGQNGLLVVEGANAGRFDIITINGDNAEVKTVKGGFKQPVSVWQIGDTAWVLEGQLATLFDPPEKRGKPGPFRAYAVELPR